ncbi:hypothetical protein U5640_36220 [Streptomyces sp. SS7]|uniref:hypothetical protein n=1 Tax=Streptomyces sp. SS7 TaxID=3108485 RepID=UPI0030EC5F15
MPTRPGLVADATTAVLAAVLADELRLEEGELKRIAARQAEALRKAGFHVTVPATTLAAARRTA